MNMSKPPSLPYPPAGDGYWGPVTATLNWCEEDYYATVYLAEIVNSLTNGFFVYLAMKGVRNCMENKHDRVFFAAFFAYLLIGIGSFLYHASLKYPMQLLDELSMIYMSCTVFYATFSFGRSKVAANLIMAFTIFLAIFVTVYYHYIKDPVFHQATFTILSATTIFRGIYDMRTNLRPTTRGSVVTRQQRDLDRRRAKIRREMRILSSSGIVAVALGFVIWILDTIFCPTLRMWRHQVGLPWGIILEGHGWWHVFTALAAYYHLTWAVWLRYCLKNQHDAVEMVWPSFFTSMPVVLRKDRLATSRKDKERHAKSS